MMFSADAGAAAMSAMRVAVAMVSFMIASPWITIDEPVWPIRFLVAFARMRDLLLRAKHLSAEAMWSLSLLRCLAARFPDVRAVFRLTGLAAGDDLRCRTRHKSSKSEIILIYQ
jgi:hypothetical protein